MTPTEGATQLTIHQVTAANASRGFQGVQFYCKVGTIEYLSTVRLQIATEHPLLCAHDSEDLCKQLQDQIGARIEDLTLEQVSPDAGRSTQLVDTFLIHKDSQYLQTPPYNCKLHIPPLATWANKHTATALWHQSWQTSTAQSDSQNARHHG